MRPILLASFHRPAESKIDRADATLTNLDDLHVAEVADWAVPTDLARDGCSPILRGMVFL